MNQLPTATVSAVAALTETDAVDLVDASEQDPAGGISLAGRNRVCDRARVLAGLVLTSGIVVALSTFDTSVSAPHA